MAKMGHIFILYAIWLSIVIIVILIFIVVVAELRSYEMFKVVSADRQTVPVIELLPN